MSYYEENYLHLSQYHYNFLPLFHTICVMLRSHTTQYILISPPLLSSFT